MLDWLAAQRQRAPVHVVTLTLDGRLLAQGLVDTIILGPSVMSLRGTSEIAVGPVTSFGLSAGGGGRRKTVFSSGADAGTLSWEGAVEPRYYLLGSFESGVYLGLRASFAAARDAVDVDEGWLHAPPGFSLGPSLGLKMAHIPILGTVDLAFVALFPIVTPANNPSPPLLVPLVPFGVGGSF